MYHNNKVYNIYIYIIRIILQELKINVKINLIIFEYWRQYIFI